MKQIVVLICLLVSVSFADARILRVGFIGIPAVTNVDYTNFFEAYTSAANGDTIYVFPGKTLGGTGWGTPSQRPEISKRLVIVSKGNWLDSTATPKGNFGLQASQGTATIGTSGQDIYFKPGSKGSVLMGFNCELRLVVLQDDSIYVKRNYALNVYLDNYSLKNITIEGNYRITITGNDNPTNIYADMLIRNNFFYQFLLPQKNYSNGLIENNLWAYDALNTATNGGDLTMSYYGASNGNAANIDLANGNWLFQNNLMLYYTNANPASNFNHFRVVNSNNATLNYNVAFASSNFTSWPGVGTGNVFINPAVASSVTEGFPVIGLRSADNRYILKAGSGANQANRPGSTTDAGMFGGNFPYKLSNIPSIPTIYSISSPDGNTPTGSSIRIDFKTRTNN